jgi:hypothetical protein
LPLRSAGRYIDESRKIIAYPPETSKKLILVFIISDNACHTAYTAFPMNIGRLCRKCIDNLPLLQGEKFVSLLQFPCFSQAESVYSPARMNFSA